MQNAVVDGYNWIELTAIKIRTKYLVSRAVQLYIHGVSKALNSKGQ